MNSVYISNEMSKNLPLKKRRIYQVEVNDENRRKFIKPPSSFQDQNYPLYVPTPPSSPHIEFIRQRYAYQSNNPIHNPQTYFDHYRSTVDQQYWGSSSNDEDFIIDEHFRKSLMSNHQKFSGRCLTPDEYSSSCSSSEGSSVGSIEQHFARSLAKFWPPVSHDDKSVIYHQITESVVDDHFAKALGAKTWEKLKDKY